MKYFKLIQLRMSIRWSFGEEILDLAPFEVIYDQNKKIWIVFPSPPGGYLGTVPKVIIRQQDGKILKLTNM